MENRDKSGENIFDEKVREKFNCFANIFKNVDIWRFISIFCQRTKAINCSFCYYADKLKQGKTL